MRRQRQASAPRDPAGPLPFSVSRHSMTSSALPIARPSGASMPVRTASSQARAAADRHHRLGERRASACGLHERAASDLDVQHERVVPSAIFLLMIEEAMSGRLSTVPVTSRSAYSFLSAGAMSCDWPTKAQPMSRTARGRRRRSGRRGIQGSIRACRSCRQCGPGRGRSSWAPARRRRPRAARRRARSCRRRRRCCACRP